MKGKIRSLDARAHHPWGSTMVKAAKGETVFKCAVEGYGPSFDMGKAYSDWIRGTERLELVIVCDIDSKKDGSSKEGFPADCHLQQIRCIEKLVLL